MGYGYYTLPDGREAGYNVATTCDRPDCGHDIDRGLGYLCGDQPDGWRAADEFGCGNYYCDPHLNDHDCPNPICGEYSATGNEYCVRPKDHALPHRDDYTGIEFTETETDLEEEATMSDPTIETDTQFTIESLLQSAITEKLPANPTPEEISEAVAAAAAILRGAGYRRIIPTTLDGHNGL